MRHTLSTMWLSDGKLPSSATILRRPGRMRAAETSSLNRFTEMVSVTVTWCGAAPSIGRELRPDPPGRGIPAGRVPGADEADAPFLLHHRLDVADTPLGNAPSELPSR